MIPQLVHTPRPAKEAANEAASTAMVYICECGRRWKMPGKDASPRGGGTSWICMCARRLSMRNGIIFAAPGEAAPTGWRVN